MSSFRRFVLFLAIAASAISRVSAADDADAIDLHDAVVAVAPGPELMMTAAKMLAEEVEKRSGVHWDLLQSRLEGKHPTIRIGVAGQAGHSAGGLTAEGYDVSVALSGRGKGYEVVTVTGADAHGALYGCGRLLRELRMGRGSVRIPANTRIASSPAFSLRGHQLGYRPKTNSYDAWTPELWEQYMRDLIVFGANAIELIPPRSDDAPDSPHFPLPQKDMMVRMSQIAGKYGLQVWIWYPAMDKDYADPATVTAALAEWGTVFKSLPRVDAVFVPGGDPGHTQPKYLMALLEKETQTLHESHPEAKMWVSPQSFNQEWMDEFVGILQKKHPAWLSGVVFGPQNRPSLHALRGQVPAQYPIRLYPDITHSIRSQYAVDDWDLAYAITEDREVINPRPRTEANIFRATKDDSIGFITYSEGCNDDVNKAVWSALGWDPSADVEDVARQYARYFVGDAHAEEFAQGLLALEQNWRGPLLTNESVEATFERFLALEKSATPQELLNWRFQQGLFRAYFDAYTRKRLIFETGLEQSAMQALTHAKKIGSLRAMFSAEAELNRAFSENVAPELRTRIFALAEALYQSIHMQLSVPLYKAIDVGRGAHLDLIDRPLNNREWLEARFAAVRAMASEHDRLKALDEITHWTNPGPGGFYDDLGNPAAQPHLVRGPGPATDPEYRESSRTGFGVRRGYRMSWNTVAESIYDAPLQMKYEGLDPKRDYKVRIVYAGDQDRNTPKVRLQTGDGALIHDYMAKPYPPEPVEFAIPHASTHDGTLTLLWNQEPRRGGSGRACQVAEIWLEVAR